MPDLAINKRDKTFSCHQVHGRPHWPSPSQIDSRFASCPHFYFIVCHSIFSFRAPRCFNQFLTSGLCVCVCVCLPSLSPLGLSVSSSCLGASSSTPSLTRGMVAGPAPAAAGTSPSGNRRGGGAQREAITLYSSHSPGSTPFRPRPKNR